MKPTATGLAIFLLGLCLLGVLIWRDLAVSGRFTIHDDLASYHPWISRLFPEGRVSARVRAEGAWQQTLLQEPVYVTVRLPRSMQRATLRLRYVARNLSSLKVGLQQTAAAGNPWRYELRDVPLVSGAEEQTTQHIFSLAQAEVQEGRIRFIVAAPQYDPTIATLTIKSIDVALEGEPLTLAATWERLWRRLLPARL